MMYFEAGLLAAEEHEMEYAVGIVGQAMHRTPAAGTAIAPRPRRIALVLLSGFSLMYLGRVVETFDVANRFCDTGDRIDDTYELLFLSANGGAIRSSSGALIWSDSIETRYGGSIHAVFVLGGEAEAAGRDERLLAWLRRAYRQTVAVQAVGGGRGVLESAGLCCKSAVDENAAHAGAIQRPIDEPDVDRDADDALADALCVVSRDCGDETAREVAARLVHTSARRLPGPDGSC
jgi:transcriptional regulator GlxA family with amidase domain